VGAKGRKMKQWNSGAIRALAREWAMETGRGAAIQCLSQTMENLNG